MREGEGEGEGEGGADARDVSRKGLTLVPIYGIICIVVDVCNAGVSKHVYLPVTLSNNSGPGMRGWRSPAVTLSPDY